MTVFEFCKALRRRIWSDSEILLLVRPAGKPLDDTKRKPCPGEIRAVTEKDLSDCAAFEDAARYVPVYREMLKRGMRLPPRGPVLRRHHPRRLLRPPPPAP